MFYLLLIIPHLVALTALLWFAVRSDSGGSDGEDHRGWGGIPEDPTPPAPLPGPSGIGPPLPDATPPRRRLRVGERLFDLPGRRRRREHAPPRGPVRAPSDA